MVNAIIMASGLSKRMDENKLLLDFNGIPMIEHTFKKISECYFNEVIVVSHYREVIDLSEKYKFKSVFNKNAYIGQSESIKLGVLNSSKCNGYMFFVGDQPFIDDFYINKMIDKFNEDKNYIIIPKFKNKIGNPVIFPYNKRNQLLTLTNDEKGKKIINKSDNIKYISVSENMLIDIDNKVDYEKNRGV
ncbi:molybdenum cofactor cytidylyltransferase [Clostridium sp.]|uniref:molybdenum cofactor cytidylyltransferase n=1 Tax=Clostridium sp. TaxID=1506 RepID=UPI002FC87F53